VVPLKFKFPIIFLILLVGCAKNNAPSLPSLYYVPQNSAVIIKINDKLAFSNELENSHLLGSFSSSKIYTSVRDKISALQYFNTDAESILAFVEMEKDNFEILFIAENGDDLIQTEEVAEKKVEKISNMEKGFDKYTLNGDTFFTAVFKDKIVVSSAQILVED